MRSLLPLLLLTAACATPGLPAGPLAVPAARALRVWALDCEIAIPADYVVQTQDEASVSFIRPDDARTSRIDISQTSEAFSVGQMRTLETKEVGHLQIAWKEFAGLTGSTANDPIPFVEIRSDQQRALLFGGATELADGIIADCARTK